MRFQRNAERLETKRFVKDIPRTPLANFTPGTTIYGLVLGSTREDTTVSELPRQIGTYGGRSIRKMLANVVAPSDGPLFGFRGPSAPYWEFRGERPSAALLVCDRGPQLLRRPEDGSTWVRFGFELEDVWLLCEDSHAIRAIDAARRTSLSGKDLALALGFKPAYVLANLSLPLDGHCYKICTGLLPRY